MSQFGKLEHIVDFETLLGYRLSQLDFTSVTDKPISYSWGDESELLEWIRLKDKKQQYNGNFITISGTDTTKVNPKEKYPLIWLVTPVYGKNATDIKNFDSVQLIICSNTEESWLNSTRWKKHIPMLQAIADVIIEQLRGNIRIKREKGILQYGYFNKPKYCVGQDAKDPLKSLDVWDAVVLNTDFLVDDTCKDEAYFEFCNK